MASECRSYRVVHGNTMLHIRMTMLEEAITAAAYLEHYIGPAFKRWIRDVFHPSIPKRCCDEGTTVPSKT
jgi:hypothetical protein